MSYIPALLHAIENRLDETGSEITRLEAARSALTTPTTTTSASSPTRTSARRSRPGASSKPTRAPAEPEPAAIGAAPEPAEPIASTIDPGLSRPGDPEPAAPSPKGSEPEPPDQIADAAAPTARKPRRRRSATRASRGTRAAATLSAGTLERLLVSTPGGLSATRIAEQASASYPATLKLLRELAASGHVRRSGERRSTSWRAITDEHRIAERAATAPRQRRSRARAS
jgi:hypothetical protein